MTPARRSDWKTEEMPRERALLKVSREYSQDQFARLVLGVVPSSMEDKWFVFFEDPWMYLHRSWTGTCIYQVRFERTERGARVAEAVANRKPGQYDETDATADAARLVTLLDSVLQRPVRQPMVRFFGDRR